MLHNRWNYEVTTSSEEAVAALDEAVLSYMAIRLDTGEKLKAAFAADPDMPMAHITRGCFLQLFAHRVFDPKIDESIAGAEAMIEKCGATPREKMHFEALKAWRAGHIRETLAKWEEILLDYPHDIFALRLAHYLHFYMGDCRNMRDSVARVSHAWDESVPGFGFVEGLRSFGNEECGNYALAEEAGRRAADINPEDIWAVHSVAHVMEMQGRHREGIAWLEGMSPHWRSANNFRYHTWWHLSLFCLEDEAFDQVLDLYDKEIRADKTEDHIDLCNATALLSRLEMQEVEIGDRWEELGEICARRIEDNIFAFHDAHYVTALTASGRDAEARKMLDAVAKAARADTTEACVYDDVGVALCEAMVAFRAGDNDRVVELLEPVRYEVYRIGGSHAQRDLFAQILLRAALAAKRPGLARALAAERVQSKPSSPPNWRLYADALELSGLTTEAAEARGQADTLLVA